MEERDKVRSLLTDQGWSNGVSTVNLTEPVKLMSAFGLTVKTA